MTRRTAVVVLTCLLVGCGEGTPGEVAPAPETPTRSEPPAPPPPSGPAVTRTRYLRALDSYCLSTTRAVEQLGRTEVDEDDPVRPVATLARRYRAGLETLGRLEPPAALRRVHLLTLAQGRESADRIDDGVRLGRAGDIDAATSALGELAGLLPELPRSVRRAAPMCAVTTTVG